METTTYIIILLCPKESVELSFFENFKFISDRLGDIPILMSPPVGPPEGDWTNKLRARVVRPSADEFPLTEDSVRSVQVYEVMAGGQTIEVNEFYNIILRMDDNPEIAAVRTSSSEDVFYRFKSIAEQLPQPFVPEPTPAPLVVDLFELTKEDDVTGTTKIGATGALQGFGYSYNWDLPV